MHLLLIFLNILVLFGDETFGESLSVDYRNWKQKFLENFNNDVYIVKNMTSVADKKAKDVAKADPVYNDDEKKAAIAIVNLYTQHHQKRKDLEIYSNVNNWLRNPSDCNNNVWSEYAKLLNRGIDTLCPNDPKTCSYGEVYRGSKHCDEVDDCDNINDQPVLFKGFTSTSTDAKVAYKFLKGKYNEYNERDGYFFCIINTKGLYIEKFTDFEGENEVLIPANTVFKMLEKLKSSTSNSVRDEITEKLRAHGVTDLIDGVNAKMYVKLEGGHTAMYGSYAALVCKCGLTFPNLSLVMVIVVMVKVVL